MLGDRGERITTGKRQHGSDCSARLDDGIRPGRLVDLDVPRITLAAEKHGSGGGIGIGIGRRPGLDQQSRLLHVDKRGDKEGRSQIDHKSS